MYFSENRPGARTHAQSNYSSVDESHRMTDSSVKLFKLVMQVELTREKREKSKGFPFLSFSGNPFSARLYYLCQVMQATAQ